MNGNYAGKENPVNNSCRPPYYNLVLIVFFSILIAGLSGCSSHSQTLQTMKADAKELPENLWNDTKKLVTERENIAILLIGGGASGYTRCAHDDKIEDHFEGHHTFPRDFTIGVGSSGSPVTHFALAGTGYLYGVMAENDEMHQVSRSLIEALSLNGILTTGLKFVAQDDSPNGEKLAWPSGHTSSSITVATVLNEYYGPAVGLPLYALSGLVMYERMETGEHWASDVIFGAAIGYTVGKTVADRYKPEIFGMQVTPFINPQSGVTGVALSKEF